MQEALFGRGLLYLDPRPGAPPPARALGRSVDVAARRAGRHARARSTAAWPNSNSIARDRGAALGLAGAATPVLVERLVAWAAGLDQRGLVLAPVSAMIRRPEGVAPEANPDPARPSAP